MAGKTIDLYDVIVEHQLATRIARYWMDWNQLKQTRVDGWMELRDYIYATDTTHTSNAKLPWSNKTTLPKLTQIRDNLYANYLATLFPKRDWLTWEGDQEEDESKEKKEAIEDYMFWAINQPEFKATVKKLILDYIDTGNCFATVDWVDNTVMDGDETKTGFIGPRARRISPYDIVFNPVATSFSNTPKIFRAIMTKGEAKKVLNALSTTAEEREVAEAVFNYAIDIRNQASTWGAADLAEHDEMYHVDGFGSFRRYLESDYIELLTFVGDIYDDETGTLLENYQIVVIDRHQIAYKGPYNYPYAELPFYQGQWRPRQDNLWAMGPLENLVGMQYRLDHIENMKADLLDLVTFPPIKIKGMVSDFEWGPMEKIYTDMDGDVELMSPDVQALQVNIEIASIENRMEELAGSPKEAMGFRTPGEKTAYEVQRLENAASRIFQNKIAQFEEQVLEPLLNSMLVRAQENLSDQLLRVVDREFNNTSFRPLTRSDLSANGRLKPRAARHFAEQAEMVQNLNNLYQSPLGQDENVRVHISGLKTAKLMEDLLNLENFELVTPYIRLSEQAEAQNQMSAMQEQVEVQTQTPSGLTPEDTSEGIV